jgi:signal transduction histidine kinase
MNLLYLLEQDQSLSPLAWEYVHTAGEELRRVGHITKNILAFNRSNEQPEPVRVTALLDDVLELFGPRIRQAGITVQKEYRSEVPIQAYPSEIRQLLANFVENSLEALSPNSSKIRVRVARGREYGNSGRQGIRIVFADDGCGISPAHRKRIFDPFYTTKGERGTGLGLWVSNDVVTRHRGSIRLHSSDEPGQSYTCFRIYLPANEEPADESS